MGRSEGSLYVPLALDLGTGLRRGELLGLRATTSTSRGGSRAPGAAQGAGTGSPEMGPCKTARSRRTVVISPALVELLALHPQSGRGRAATSCS